MFKTGPNKGWCSNSCSHLAGDSHTPSSTLTDFEHAQIFHELMRNFIWHVCSHFWQALDDILFLFGLHWWELTNTTLMGVILVWLRLLKLDNLFLLSYNNLFPTSQKSERSFFARSSSSTFGQMDAISPTGPAQLIPRPSRVMILFWKCSDSPNKAEKWYRCLQLAINYILFRTAHKKKWEMLKVQLLVHQNTLCIQLHQTQTLNNTSSWNVISGLAGLVDMSWLF